MTAANITVVMRKQDGTTIREVEGQIVAPGIALAQVAQEPNRYSLVHLASGLSFVWNRCGRHAAIAAELVRKATDVDWTVPVGEVMTDQAKDLHKQIRNAIGWACDRRCDVDPDAVSWEVRCSTCDWEWDGEDDEGPLDAEEAKRLARDHECEPYVEIKGPGMDRWHEEWRVNKDGTLYEVKAAKS